MKKIVIIDSQEQRFEQDVLQFMNWLNKAYFNTEGDIVINLAFQEEKTIFSLEHLHPLGNIVVFDSIRRFKYAPAFDTFPLMWAKNFYELGYSVYLFPRPKNKGEDEKVKSFLRNINPILLFNPPLSLDTGYPIIKIVQEVPLWEGGGLSIKEMQAIKEKTEQCFVFCVERSWCKILREFGIKNVYFLPHFAPLEICYPTEHLEKSYDISFVGNLMRPQCNLPSEIKRLVDGHLKKKKEDYGYQFLSLLDKDIFELYNKAQGWEIMKAVHTNLGFHYENMRYFILSKLAEKYKITLWGWPWCIPEEFKKHPNIDYKGPARWVYLPIIFGLSKINLNVHRIVYDYATQERTFMFAFCKAFFLTDYKEIFKDFFPEVYKEITFRDISELNVKVDYYLTHESERREIVNYLYKEAISHHTMKQRAKQILKVMRGGK